MRSRAFTLVEMLVSMAVLSLLAVFISQIISLSSSALSSSSRKLKSTADMRFVLDRIGFDLEARVRRSDVAQTFVSGKATGNDSFSFYSEVDGYTADNSTLGRRVSNVDYQIAAGGGNNQLQLQRGVVATLWTSGSGVSFLAPVLPVIPPDNYDCLSASVLRLEVNFLKSDGTLSNSAKGDLSDVSAVIVTIASLDPASRGLMTATEIGQVSDALPDSTDNNDTLSSWESAFSQTSFLPGFGKRTRILEALRFSQRYYNVP